MNPSPKGKLTDWRVIAALLAAAVVIVLVIVVGQVYAYQFESSAEPADVAIVLGAAVWRDRPSPVFRERIRHAVALYHSGQVERLIFTGGVGRGDRLAESEVARAFAVSLGVPAEDIAIETESAITYENLVQACGIMTREGWDSALVVSDPFHMKRAVTIARDIGLDAAPSPTPTSRYRSWWTTSPAVAYETLYFLGHVAARAAGQVPACV